MDCLHCLDKGDLLIIVIGLWLNQSKYQSAHLGLSKHINSFGLLLSWWGPKGKKNKKIAFIFEVSGRR